jgi:hypothetical protein
MFSPRIALERYLRLWLVMGVALAASVTRSQGGELAAVSETNASEPDADTAAPWRVFAVSGASSEVSPGANALRVRLAAGDHASCVREIGPEALRAVVCRFNISLQGADAEQVFRVGSELTTSNVDDADVHTYARLGVRGVGAADGSARGFRLRDLVARHDSPVFQGTQAVTWALNHTGRAITYASPDGALETVASDHMDVWVGRTKVFDDIGITQSTVPLTDLKWYWGTGAGTTAFDHLQIAALEDGGVAGVPVPDASPVVDAAQAAPEPVSSAPIELYRPSPNPFARTTRFAYAISGATEAVEIGVFDVAGRQVRGLIRENQSAGRYEVAWDGRNDAGDHVHNGIYFLRASIGNDLRVARIAYLLK